MVLIYDTGSIRFPTGVDMGRRWDSNPSKTLQLSFPVGALSGMQEVRKAPLIAIQCRGFRKNNMDILTRQYSSPSGIQTVEFPPFAVSNKEAARKSLESLVDENLAYFVDILKINAHDIHQVTLDEAMEHRHEACVLINSNIARYYR